MVNRISSERKVEKNFEHASEYSKGPLGDVVGTSRINLLETSLKRQIRTFPGRHFRTSPGRQIGTFPGRQIRASPGRSNRIFRGRPGDVGGGRPRDVLRTNTCTNIEGTLIYCKLNFFVYKSNKTSNIFGVISPLFFLKGCLLTAHFVISFYFLTTLLLLIILKIKKSY